MSKKDATLDSLLAQKDWHTERKLLRDILLDCGLTEAIKWGQLCYTYDDSNIAIIFCFKDSFGVGFPKGVLLDNPQGLLVKPGKNTHAARRMDFVSLDDLNEKRTILKSTIENAIAIEKKGLKVDKAKRKEPGISQEMQEIFTINSGFKKAFENLTPGRQRGYLLYFNEAKQSATRTRRIARHMDRIIDGKGMHDR